MRVHVAIQDGHHVAEVAKSDFNGFLERLVFEDDDNDDGRLEHIPYELFVRPNRLVDDNFTANCRLLRFAEDDDGTISVYEVNVPDDTTWLTMQDCVWVAMSGKPPGFHEEPIILRDEPPGNITLM